MIRIVALIVLAGCGPSSPVETHGGKAPPPPGTTSTPPAPDDQDADGDGSPAPVDCDDADSTVFPGAPDTWYDGVDANCDGADDFDADADGDPAAAYQGGDCDEADPTRHATAPRVCGNETDDDCDLEPDCDLRGELMAEDVHDGTFTGEVAAGVYAEAGDLDGEGFVDVIISSGHADTTWVFEGPLVGAFRGAAEAYAVLPGGRAGVGLGDFDGDGVQDLATNSVGVFTETTTRVWSGGRFDPDRPAAQLVHALGDANTVTLVGGADLDGDGIDELLIGGIGGCQITGWDAPGCAQVFTGPIVGVFGDTAASTMILGEEGTKVDGEGPGLRLDAESDLTGDGLRDLALIDIIDIYGKFYVLESPLPPVQLLEDAMASMVPPPAPDLPKVPSVAAGVATGDLDGDGHADLVLSSSGVIGSGPVWIFRGPIGSGTLDPAMAAVTLQGVAQSGNSVVKVLGDFDGSGGADLAVERFDASVHTYAAPSSVALYYDPVGAAEPDLILHDSVWGPTHIVAPGDVDGDGLVDMITGSVGVLDSSGVSQGGAYLILGRATGF